MQVESSAIPMLTIDEVEKVQRQKIEETELLNRFSGCSKRQRKTSLRCSRPTYRAQATKNAIFSAVFPARAFERSQLSLATTFYFFNNKVHKTTLSCEYTSLRTVAYNVHFYSKTPNENLDV